MQSTKFTPTSLDDFVFGNPTSRKRLDDILNGHSDFPNEKRALLLFGNAGTGKSELAKFLPSLLESSTQFRGTANAGGIFETGFTGLTTCRHDIKPTQIITPLIKRSERGVYSPKGWRYEIFDEVDELSTPLINALKGAMTQQETESIIFIFTTNNQAKLGEPFTSRCIPLPMWRPKAEELIPVGRATLRRIGLNEDLLSESVILDIANHHKCDLRGFLSELRTHARKTCVHEASTS